MPADHRYTITLTSSRPDQLPKVRVLYRPDDESAIDAAERELRRHRNIHGTRAVFDGWRVRASTPINPRGRLVAEVRPGYDSRTVPANNSNGDDTPPF